MFNFSVHGSRDRAPSGRQHVAIGQQTSIHQLVQFGMDRHFSLILHGLMLGGLPGVFFVWIATPLPVPPDMQRVIVNWSCDGF